MNDNEYRRRVVELFKSGHATNEQWDAMSKVVSLVSERGLRDETEVIDAVITGPFVSCELGCGTNKRQLLDCDACES